MNFVLVPADKAANNAIVVLLLNYNTTLNLRLADTNAHKLLSYLSERVIEMGMVVIRP